MVYLVRKKEKKLSTADYTYLILSFLTGLFFILVVIRPSIGTIIQSYKELNDLKEINARYEQTISKIISTSYTLRSNSAYLPLLNQAVPSGPSINTLAGDALLAASRSGITLKRTAIGEVNLKESGGRLTLKSADINLALDSDFTKVRRMLEELIEQRRLKTIKEFSITKTPEGAVASDEATINIVIEGYYL